MLKGHAAVVTYLCMYMYIQTPGSCMSLLPFERSVRATTGHRATRLFGFVRLTDGQGTGRSVFASAIFVFTVEKPAIDSSAQGVCKSFCLRVREVIIAPKFFSFK